MLRRLRLRLRLRRCSGLLDVFGLQPKEFVEIDRIGRVDVDLCKERAHLRRRVLFALFGADLRHHLLKLGEIDDAILVEVVLREELLESLHLIDAQLHRHVDNLRRCVPFLHQTQVRLVQLQVRQTAAAAAAATAAALGGREARRGGLARYPARRPARRL